MPVLQLRQPPEKNFWQRLFGKEPGESAFVAVNNLLVQRKILEVSLDQVLDLVEAHGFFWRRRFIEDKKRLYSQWLESCLDDQRYDEVEVQKLRHLKDILLLNDYEIGEVHQAISMQRFSEVMDAAADDRRLSEALRGFLYRIENTVKLPSRFAHRLEEAPLNPAMEELLSELPRPATPLSEEEEAMLSALASVLRIRIEDAPNPRETLKEYQMLWKTLNGFWPRLPVDFSLETNEYCVFYSNAFRYAALSEERAHTNRYSLLRRVDKGVDWQWEDFQQRLPEPPQAQQAGRLYLTNFRLVFRYQGHMSSIKLKQIRNYCVRRNGVVVVQRKKPALTFRFEKCNRLFAVMMARVLADYFSPQNIVPRRIRQVIGLRPG
jgi:hypothetical protein